jgi:hypothetical protein
MKRPSKLASILAEWQILNKEFNTLYQSKSAHDHQPFLFSQHPKFLYSIRIYMPDVSQSSFSVYEEEQNL